MFAIEVKTNLKFHWGFETLESRFNSVFLKNKKNGLHLFNLISTTQKEEDETSTTQKEMTTEAPPDSGEEASSTTQKGQGKENTTTQQKVDGMRHPKGPPDDPARRDVGRASSCQACPLCGACVRSKLACGFLGLCRCTVVAHITRMSMTLVVRASLCLYAGGAWVLWGWSLFLGVN